MADLEEKITDAATDPEPEKEQKEEVKQPKKKAEAKKPKKRVHVVAKGDTLRSIAMQYYGKAWKMEAIRKANGLATDVLKVGRELVIP